MVRTTDMTGWCETLDGTTESLAFALRSPGRDRFPARQEMMVPLAWWILVSIQFLQRTVLKVGSQPAIWLRGWDLAGGG